MGAPPSIDVPKDKMAGVWSCPLYIGSTMMSLYFCGDKQNISLEFQQVRMRRRSSMCWLVAPMTSDSRSKQSLRLSMERYKHTRLVWFVSVSVCLYIWLSLTLSVVVSFFCPMFSICVSYYLLSVCLSDLSVCLSDLSACLSLWCSLCVCPATFGLSIRIS